MARLLRQLRKWWNEIRFNWRWLRLSERERLLVIKQALKNLDKSSKSSENTPDATS